MSDLSKASRAQDSHNRRSVGEGVNRRADHTTQGVSSSSSQVAVHIGYHKTATTWFQRIAFPSHPQLVPYLANNTLNVLVSDPFLNQIVSASDSDFDMEKARTEFAEQAATLITHPEQLVILSAERLSGHAASGGSDGIRTAERLFGTIPEARVFWLVRDQAEAIKSEYRQIVRLGWPADVQRTLAVEPRWKTTGFDLAYWEYDRLVSRYKRLFGPERVLVLDYGRFTRDPSDCLAEISTFLGVKPWSLTDEQFGVRFNVSRSDSETRVRQLLNHFHRTELNPYPPFELPEGMRKTLIRQHRLFPKSYRLFEPSFDEWAEERFAASNQRLMDEHGIVLTRSRK
jgi:Sulfotransferase family